MSCDPLERKCIGLLTPLIWSTTFAGAVTRSPLQAKLFAFMLGNILKTGECLTRYRDSSGITCMSKMHRERILFLMPGEFARMFFRSVLSLFVLFMSFLEAVADSPKTRIDFNQPGRSATYSGVAFVFDQATGDCPEQDGTIVIEKGAVQLISPWVLAPSKPTNPLTGLTGVRIDAADDTSYRVQFLRPTCQIEIGIRQQRLEQGEWKSLLVAEDKRPSLSEQTRSELLRKRRSDVQARASRVTSDEVQAEQQRRSQEAPPGRWSIMTTGLRIRFEDAISDCINAFGEYQVFGQGFAMSFFSPLGQGVNQFLMEGTDLDSSHGQIVLINGDCRFEFTVSQTAVIDGRRVSVPLRSAPERK